MPRVALVTHDLSLGGGTGTMTAYLYRVLKESGRYQPDIISLALSASDAAGVRFVSPRTWLRGAQAQQKQWRGLNYTHVGAVGSEWEVQRFRPRRVLTNLLEQYDLVQFVVGSPPYLCAASNVDRPRLLWTATTSWADRASRVRNVSPQRRLLSLLTARSTRVFERRAVREADVVFALSDYTLKSVRALSSRKPIILAPCGVDTQFYTPASSPQNSYILCAGRLGDARKNIPLLLKAYAQLSTSRQDLPELCLVGEPPSPTSQKMLDDLNIAGKVRLLGEKQGADLAEVYRNASYFVLSSDEEGLGIVILEAMSSGLPVVSTDCGGPSTMIKEGETGFLTPVGDAEALAQAISKLLDDPDKARRMGQAGRRLVEERFSMSATGAIFLNKYDELLKGKL